MAFYTFHVPVDASGSIPIENLDEIEVLSTSPTEFRAGLNGVTLVILRGNFILDEVGDPVGGTLTGWQTFSVPDGATLESEAGGFSIDLFQLAQWVLYGDEASLTNAFFGGDDLFTGSYGNDELSGEGGADTLRGGTGDDTLIGGDGDDSLEGGAGNDSMSGGAGSDRYEVREPGDQVVEGPNGNPYETDTVFSWLGSYTLPYAIENLQSMVGTGGWLIGNFLANRITGGDGPDTLVGLEGDDVLDGGAGLDTAEYSSAPAAVQVDLGNFVPRATGGAGTDELRSIENVIGSRYADRLTGDGGANRLEGGGGADTLDGAGGADTMAGGAGNDIFHVRDDGDVAIETGSSPASGIDTVLSWRAAYTLGPNIENATIMSDGAANLAGNGLDNLLVAGAGDNRLGGGAGIDTVSYAGASAGVRVSLSISGAQATGGSGSDTLAGIESLRGSSFADRLTGDFRGNELVGGAGNDTLAGRGGNDTLTGNAGSDTFRFDTAPDALANVDTVTGFSHADDRIELENAVFAALGAPGALDPTMFRASLTGLPKDGGDHLLYETDTGKLFYDADGTGPGDAVLVAVFSGTPAIWADDFFVT